jgi:hypothetical protein
LSAAGSAAQRARIEEDQSDALIGSAEVDSVRPHFRVVAGAPSVIEPVVEDGDYKAAVLASDPGDEDEDEDWPEDLPEDLTEDSSEDLPKDLLDSESEIEQRSEARVDGGGSKAPFMEAVESSGSGSLAQSAIRNPQSAIRSKSRRPGLKKLTKKQVAMDWPPAPRGCEWRRSDEGLNLWRCWTEWDGEKNRRIKKSRYAGHLSDDAWRIMKEYDHEAFISIVGERLRRHGGR